MDDYILRNAVKPVYKDCHGEDQNVVSIGRGLRSEVNLFFKSLSWTNKISLYLQVVVDTGMNVFFFFNLSIIIQINQLPIITLSTKFKPFFVCNCTLS